MSAPVCLYQEVCRHYKTGDNKPKNHDVRNKYPCKQWLAMDCEKMWLLVELQEFATGEIVSCEVAKVRRLTIEDISP